MSRSKRRTPIIPVANIESEKNEKRLAHQRERKWLHDHLNPRTASMEDFDIKMFHLHPHSGRTVSQRAAANSWATAPSTTIRAA